MKTLEEFIQRLQEDEAFEKQAQAFDNGDELIAFVRGEGYDFTLEQLLDEFKQGAKLRAEADSMAPAPTDASASSPLRPDEPEFTPQPETFPDSETSAALGERGSSDSTREPPGQKLQEPPQRTLPPPGPGEESSAGLFRGGGGRLRGFSPQRLKSSEVEDS
jgi:predicted ribosomally synthesized peptide with nif11-like leader